MQVPLNKQFIDTIPAVDASGNPAGLSALSLMIDDYQTAYVAACPGAGINGFMVTPKNQSLMGIKTVTITANAKDANGTMLPAVSLSLDIMGTPVPNPAQSISFGTGLVGTFPSTPDPGSDTAVLI